MSLLNNQDIDFVNEIAWQAGDLAKTMRHGVEIKEKSGPNDLVTQADFAVSHFITTKLCSRFPKDLIISEEDEYQKRGYAQDRFWLVDPIDGTQGYVQNNGHYCVMIGLIVDGKPEFGAIYSPETKTLYYGGQQFGSFYKNDSGKVSSLNTKKELSSCTPMRILIGNRDRRSHPWISDLSGVRLLYYGSIGLKAAKILDGQADLFVHLSGKLKSWDAAAPAAISMGAGLEVGQADGKHISLEVSNIEQEWSMVIGRPGSLEWCQKHIFHPPQMTSPHQ